MGLVEGCSVKVYVAGPMTGLPEFNYPAFRRAGAALEGAGFEVLNPVALDDGVAHEWVWYMRGSLAMLLGAEGVALLPGYSGSRGARIELRVAQGLRLRVAPLVDWVGVWS